jgi:uncharacterized coiled-coil protein SlyX
VPAQPIDPAVGVTPAAPAPELTPPATPIDPRAEQQRQAQSQLDATELAQAHQTIAQLQTELRAANQRLAALEAHARQEAGGLPTNPMGVPRAENPFAPSAAPAPAVSARVPRAQRYWHVEPESVQPVPNPGAPPPMVGIAPAPTPPAPSAYNQSYGVVIRDPTTGAIKEIQTQVLPGAVGSATGASETERLDKIEAQLRMLMDEIATMRQRPNAGTGLPTPAPAGR